MSAARLSGTTAEGVASIYNTILYFSPQGELVQHHRKLVPTGAERTVWSPGGPIREREESLYADLDLGMVASARRLIDPTGHYNRPDVFQLLVDTRPRSAVHEATLGVSSN